MVPLFLPRGAEKELAKLRRAHDEGLTTLLKPLEALTKDERAAINADGAAAAIAKAWEANQQTLANVLPNSPPATLELPSSSKTSSDNTSTPNTPKSVASYESAAQILAHLARDWSRAGDAARRRTYAPVLRALRRERRKLRVLVPGAGLSRLAYEIARLGHHVEAADVSVGMAVASHAVISGSLPAGLRVHPHVGCESGVLDRRACLQSNVLETPRPPPTLTLRTAAFGDTTATFDAVVTSYFLDTLDDAAAAVRAVARTLAPGGVWVNVGPLQWHRPTGMRLTFDELRSLIAQSGLDVGRSTRVLRRVPYLASPRALASGNEHDCVFFVARAPAIVRNRTWGGFGVRRLVVIEKLPRIISKATSYHVL